MTTQPSQSSAGLSDRWGIDAVAASAAFADRVERLVAQVAAVEALADEYDRHENWRIWGVPQSIRAALTTAEPAPVSGVES